MKLRYYSEFKSIKENEYRLEIHTLFATYSEPIILSPDPFMVEYESDELYQPLKLSSATVSILTNAILSDLYTGENQGVEVRLYNKTENVLEWFGYLTPNLYSSQYITSFDNIELEAIDTLSSLDNVKYSYIGDNGVFRPFLDILLFILEKADPKKIINIVYIQKTSRMSKESILCLFEESYIHERNFFDESNEPETCRDVISSLVKYYGMTIIQWRDAYYIIDYDFINQVSYEFFAYNRGGRTCSDIIFNAPVRSVSDVGVSESAGNISLGNVYNKVSVVASMNVISDMIPDIMSDEDLVNQNEDKNKYYISVESINNEQHTLLTAFFKSKKNWDYKRISGSLVDSSEAEDEVTIDNVKSIKSAVFWQKCDSYISSSGEPSSINWKTYLSFVFDGDSWNFFEPYIQLKNRPPVIFKGGFFIIDFKFKMSSNALAHDSLVSSNEVYSWTKFGTGFTDTMIPCRLSIGGFYYDGERWVDYAEYYLKSSRGYYKSIRLYTTYEDLYWYRYYDEYGYQRFVSEIAWNALPQGTVKDKGNYQGPKNARILYFFEDGNNNKIFVPQSFYHECILRDQFYLVHRNYEGDRVFNEEKSLTNTVSYKLNIRDSEDGVAIKLPPDILFGDLLIRIGKPNHLGTRPMFTTDGTGGAVCRAFHFTDLLIKYTNNKSTYDIFSGKSDDLDTVYSNVISDNNITEMEDISLNINSYSKGVASYSNAATKIGDKWDYVDGVYSPIGKGRFIPEQILIDKLYRHYCAPKFKYQNCLNRGFSILSRIKENSLNKIMVVDSTNINYANESCVVNLIEV